MLIPCKDIVSDIKKTLLSKMVAIKKQVVSPKLVTYLLKSTPEQESFIAIKKRVAQELGIMFESKTYDEVPEFSAFLSDMRSTVALPQTTGVIVQHPLPQGYDQQVMYEAIPVEKEIEGHRPDSPFFFPLALAVLTGIKYIIMKESGHKIDSSIIVQPMQDKALFQNYLKSKKIVVAGRGPTGGGPIARAFNNLGVEYQIVHSKTSNAQEIFISADIIVTATGTHLIKQKHIKPGVVLLNVGLRKQEGKLKGDFDEEDIKDVASYYNQTPGGLGPLDVVYLYSNLLSGATMDSYKAQFSV